MKRSIAATITALALFVAGCSSTPAFKEGEDAEITFDGLHRMQGTVMDVVWARPDVDLKGFSKVKFEGLGVEFRPVTGPYSGRAGIGTSQARSGSRTEFQLDEDTKQLFIDEISSAFLERMGNSEVFTIVEEPGPDVLLVSVGLLDVVSRVPPETTGRSRIFIDSVGEATVVLEVRDSESNAIFARAVDGRAMDRPGGMIESNRATNRAEVRRLGRRWADIVRNGLETLMTEGI